MIATLTLVACMSGDPQNCRRTRWAGVSGCFVAAAMVAAAWADENPAWRVVEARCS